MPTIWVEVKKQEEPPLPDIPEICEDWVNNSTLYQSDDLPELYSEISIQERTNDLNENGEPIVRTKKLSLSDHPEVEKVWEKYLDENWLPWRELHSKWEGIQTVYTKLFEIHQERQKLGEEYELILGIGFLKWRIPNQQEVKRHLLTAKASLSFDPETGKFTVTEDEDGAQLATELEMLDTYRPQLPDSAIKETLLSADDNPWDRSSVDVVLSSLTNLLAEGQGMYHSKNIKPSHSSISSTPVVDFAPAIILRKRSMRGFEMRLDEIREFIKSGKEIPSWFADLCEKKAFGNNEDPLNDQPTNKNYTIDNTTLYFPLPSNDQQRKIAEILTKSNGVLVQGPPGTGKTETIANLICHLLANEKRVLVTAKTPRALQVLHDKLPKQIQPLCVSMLGQGLEERESLKRSISQIHAKESEWDELIADNKIAKLKMQLHATKSQLAKLERNCRSIREKDLYEQVIINGKYRGTATKIAERLQKEQKEFGWLKDKIKWDQEIPISHVELHKLYSELKVFTPELKSELHYDLPNSSELPQQKHFENFVKQERFLLKKLEDKKMDLDSHSAQLLLKANKDEIEQIIQSIGKLSSAVERIKNRPLSWIDNAVFEMLTDKDTPWKELQSACQKKLEGLKVRARIVDSQELQIPPEMEKIKVLNDGKKLKKHLQDGGKIGIGPFRPKIVREVKYLLNKVVIESEKTNSLNVIEKLIENLSVQLDIEYIWSLWKGKAERLDGPLFMQVAEQEELQEALDSVVGLYGLLEDAKAKASIINGIHAPSWHKQEVVNEFLRVCNTVSDKIKLKGVQGQVEEIELSLKKLITQLRMHPAVDLLLQVIIERNEKQFTKVLSKINELNNLKKRFKWVNEQKGILSGYVPLFVEDFFNNSENSKWDNRLSQFEAAWNWARTNSWINNYLNDDNVTVIEQKIKTCEENIKDIITVLASEKAWKSCFPMQEDHRRNLKMFQNIRIPKTGKNVLRRRKEAQKYLEGCKDAISAWIMPLHRVYDTIRAKPNSFDVIIIDEASQCGPEALPLLFIGSKIIVVGDDKQISPMTVGINEVEINQTIDRFLYDFQYKESFDPRMSLFKQAEVRFSHQIYLREHFRCMPEIIRFSDNLCYAREGKPLIPMRQFSATQRLKPLELVHIPDGYREGDHSRAINKREAEKIAEIIAQCCNDDRYENKTMGVITLQGHAQDKLIEDILLKEIGAEEMENRKLICGDAYSFQGDERDIIFLSMVAAPNVRIGPLVKEDDERRFNVAASRAKDQMWLFHTATINDLSTNCLRRKLLSYFINPAKDEFLSNIDLNIDELRLKAYNDRREIGNQPKPFDSWFEVDVYLEIVNRGYRAISQFESANKYIDIVVEGESGSQIAVECDGDVHHGFEQYDGDMERQRDLERVGWKFHRIRECAFKASQEETLNQLWKELEYRGISPIEKTVAVDQGKVEKTKSEDKSFPKSFLFEEMGDEIIVKVANVQEALGLRPSVLRELVKQTLKERPNQTSQKEALPGFVLKKLKVISRGQPRETFYRKVKQALTYLRNHGEIQGYRTNKNKRVRLVD